jgi:hypothetical protein
MNNLGFLDGNLFKQLFGSIVVDILDYSNTNKYKTTRSLAVDMTEMVLVLI